MAGGKGGSQTTRVQIPGWLEDAGQRTVQRGEDVARIGYVPWGGPDVAATTPMQNAAFQGANSAANAFGLPTVSNPTGMPQASTYAGGVRGYSGRPMYDRAIADLQANRPGQYDAIMRMFVNPGRPR